MFTSREENSVDPDHFAFSESGSTLFSKQVISWLMLLRVKNYV